MSLALTGGLFTTAPPGRTASGSHSTAPRHAGTPSPSATPSPTVSPTTIATSSATSDSDRRDAAFPGEPVAPACEIRSINKIRTSRSHDFWIPGTHFVDGPGGKIKVWIEREHNVETTLLLEKEARIQFDFKSFLEEVRKMVSPIITTRIRIELGHEYTRLIRKGEYGHMRYRVFGYKISFWQWRQFGNCSIRFVGAGLADIPTTKQGWKYWESKGP